MHFGRVDRVEMQNRTSSRLIRVDPDTRFTWALKHLCEFLAFYPQVRRRLLSPSAIAVAGVVDNASSIRQLHLGERLGAEEF
jgi:hypothetical protein